MTQYFPSLAPLIASTRFPPSLSSLLCFLPPLLSLSFHRQPLSLFPPFFFLSSLPLLILFLTSLHFLPCSLHPHHSLSQHLPFIFVSSPFLFFISLPLPLSFTTFYCLHLSLVFSLLFTFFFFFLLPLPFPSFSSLPFLLVFLISRFLSFYPLPTFSF